MPYIPNGKANEIDKRLKFPDTKGELNYAISNLIAVYLERKGLSYQSISDAIDAARGAAREAERLVLEPYEDEKRANPDNADPFDIIGPEAKPGDLRYATYEEYIKSQPNGK